MAPWQEASGSAGSRSSMFSAFCCFACGKKQNKNTYMSKSERLPGKKNQVDLFHFRSHIQGNTKGTKSFRKGSRIGQLTWMVWTLSAFQYDYRSNGGARSQTAKQSQSRAGISFPGCFEAGFYTMTLVSHGTAWDFGKEPPLPDGILCVCQIVPSPSLRRTVSIDRHM